MSPLAKLRVELTNLVYRIEKSPMYAHAEVARACCYIQMANDILGAALVRELEAAKAKEPQP